MIPDSGIILKDDFKIREIPSKTYRIDSGGIAGTVDGLEAVKQAVFCILNTERFDQEVYSWNYGMERKTLFGRNPGVVKSKLKKRIMEALMQDDRITSIDAFSFSVSGRRLYVSFCVHTKFGVMEAGTEVEI